jgi:hypothetical protein
MVPTVTFRPRNSHNADKMFIGVTFLPLEWLCVCMYASPMTAKLQDTARVTVSLPGETHEWLLEHAWRTRRPVSRVLRDMIEAVRREADSPHARILAQEDAIRRGDSA